MTFSQYYIICFNFFLYFFHVFIIYSIIIFVILFSNLYLPNNINVAFILNIISNNYVQNSQYEIKKIYFLQFNKAITKLHFPQIAHQFFYLKRAYKKNLLNKYLTFLKLSGFANSINYKRIIINKKQYCRLYIKFNPVIKSIIITDYSNLIISSKKLQKIFNKHIGLPLNYKLINQSLQNIFLWYRLHGFEWVRIRLIYDYKSKIIKISIKEGAIVSSKIICKSNYKTRDYLVTYKAITTEMKSLNGSILNKNELNTKIQIIKNKYALQDTSYKIIFNTRGLDIILKYSMQSNKLIKIYYLIYILNNMYTFFRNYTITYIVKINKLYNVLIDKYNLIYIMNIKIKLQNYYLFFCNLYFIVLSCYNYSQSFNLFIYSFDHIIYSFNLIWTQIGLINIKQQIFLLNLIKFETINKYYINESIKFIQQIVYIKYQFYCKYIISHKIEMAINQYIRKYRQINRSNILFYSIKITKNYYYQFMDIFIHSFIKINYYLFFYLNHNYIKFYTQYLQFSIYNKFSIQIEKNAFHINSNLHILNILLNKLNLHKFLFRQFNNFNYQLVQPNINLYIQYSFHINKYNSIYLFNNYIDNVRLPINLSSLHKSTNLLGLGLQINIPFKQIPYIRLEYIINIKKQIYIFIDKFSI